MPGQCALAGSGEPLAAQRWAVGTYRIVDYRGRRPPETGVDEWGVTWAPLPAGGDVGAGNWPVSPSALHIGGEIAGSYPAGYPAASARELLDRPFPDGRDPAPFAGQPWATEASLPSRTRGPRVLVAGRHPLGPLDRFCALLGPERGLLALLEEPDAARAALDRIADYHVAIAHNYLAAGCTAGWLADEYAGAAGPLVRPSLWRRLILPGLRRLIAVYRAASVPVCFHMCGRAQPFVADLIAAGAGAFDLEVY